MYTNREYVEIMEEYSQDINMVQRTKNSFDMRSRETTGKHYSIKDNLGYWVSVNGRKLFPNEFDYTHLLNTIKKIERDAYDCYVFPDEFRIYRLLKEELAARISNAQNLDN